MRKGIESRPSVFVGGERGTGGPLGGIQLVEPSVCNGMARRGGDKQGDGKALARGQSVGVDWDCGCVLEVRRASLVGFGSRLGPGTSAVAKATHGGSCPTRPPGIPSSSTEGAPRRQGIDRRAVGSQWRARFANPLLLSLGARVMGAVKDRWVVRRDGQRPADKKALAAWTFGGGGGHNGLYRTSPIGRRGRVGLEGPFCVFVKQHGLTKAAMDARVWSCFLKLGVTVLRAGRVKWRWIGRRT